jgi:hypothetical protein
LRQRLLVDLRLDALELLAAELRRPRRERHADHVLEQDLAALRVVVGDLDAKRILRVDDERELAVVERLRARAEQR